MTDWHAFTFCGASLVALPTGSLWWPATRTLTVSDLHLGKSARIARRSGTFLPPYETGDTLARLASDIALTDPARVICLGDSFDDLQAARDLPSSDHATLASLQAGRQWVWIEGNHDPGPVAVGGAHHAEFALGPLTFRHIATEASAEVSGHFHPKYGLQGAGPARACFIYDQTRLILPAFGTYTGGLHCDTPVIRDLFGPAPVAVLTGSKAIAIPVTKIQRGRRFRGRSY